MMIEDMPWCCAACVLGDLEDEPDFDCSDDPEEWYDDEIYELSDRGMQAVVRDYGAYMIIATTTLEQATANRLLRKYGFVRTQFHRKKYNPRTRVALWHRDPRK